MIVLVCGGRNYTDMRTITATLDAVHLMGSITLLVHGAAHGTDMLAGRWAANRGIPVQDFPADWDRHGRMAGSIRNHKMLTEMRPNLVVGFPGGHETAHMLEIAAAAGIRVIRIP